MPYGITQCYLPTSRGDIPAFTSARLVLDLATLEGCKAELAWLAGYVPRCYTHSKTVTHPSTNWARRGLTSFTTTPSRQPARPTDRPWNVWRVAATGHICAKCVMAPNNMTAILSIRVTMATTNNKKTFEKLPVGILFIEVNTNWVRGRSQGSGGCRSRGRGCGRVHRWRLAASRTTRLGKNSLGGQEPIHLIAEQQHSSSLTPFALPLHKHDTIALACFICYLNCSYKQKF